MKRLITICIIILLIPLAVMAHPGSLDSNGGHHDRKTGEYHYHSGIHKYGTASSVTAQTYYPYTPEPTIDVTPEPTPTPTPEPTLSPEELDRLIAEEEARWRQEALDYAAENLPQNYKELVYEYYLLLEAYDELVVDNENLESRVYDLEEEVMDLEDDLDYQMGY